MELNEATSEFVTGDHRASSALSPYPGASRKESNVAISSTFSHSLSSSGEEDESVDAFNRRGHQGSYVLRKASLHLTTTSHKVFSMTYLIHYVHSCS